ncbi:MAG: aminopeptidase P family protein [Clostridia bacterium]|nr:aminopeptidase P family protein [Clostridia bacterium]
MQSFFMNNRENLCHFLEDQEALVLFSGKSLKSSADAFYPFRVNKNFYYATGLKRENFAVALLRRGDEVAVKLFIEAGDEHAEKWYGRKMKKEMAQRVSGIEDIVYIDAFHTWLNNEIYEGRLKKLYLDLEKISWQEPDGFVHREAAEIKSRYPFLVLDSIHPYISELRTRKYDFELEAMRQAIKMTEIGLEKVLQDLKPGVYEYQLASTFLHEVQMAGGDGLSFDTIAASGDDGVILHYVENNKPVAGGTLLLFDCGAQYNEYCADITRTYPASGTFSERQKLIYNIVLKAEEACIKAAKPGMTFESLNAVCKAVLTAECKAIGLIKDDEELSKYYYHGVSHFLGLDAHDVGSRQMIFEEGMVITVEPGLYIAEEGIGIRIEDDVLITESGGVDLSKGIIKTIEEIETFMAMWHK